VREGVLSTPPAAVSLGGAGDVGGEFPEDLQAALTREVGESGLPLLHEPDLRSNVMARMDLFGRPAAFVNIGGSHANLGVSPRVLGVPPGPVQGADLPAPGERGVLFEMLSRGVPVIHLLHIRGLALRYGLSWDPVPLPDPGSTPLRDESRGKGFLFWLLTAGYVASLSVIGLATPPARAVTGLNT
jgi:poly-gamma-glutamate system protein